MDKEKLFGTLAGKIEAMLKSEQPNRTKLELICKLLKNNIPGYDWVGFYIVDPQKNKELILGPFIGEPTEHVRIPFGRGICGRAADTGKTVIVSDVSGEDNYLACSTKVKSEIVVPIFRDNRLVGELDIDSHEASAFNDRDKQFLLGICKNVSKII
jgi:L-methionine (R)-S-oxide reductase